MVALSALSGIGDGVIQRWVSSMGMLPVLAFSREQEETADADALEALLQTYGHVDGAAHFFEHISVRSALPKPPALLSTHPDTKARIARIRDFADVHAKPVSLAAYPLPAYMRSGKSGTTE